MQHLGFRAGSHFEINVDFGGLDALHVLIEFRATGPAGRGGDLRDGQQDLLQCSAELIGFGETRARKRNGTYG